MLNFFDPKCPTEILLRYFFANCGEDFGDGRVCDFLLGKFSSVMPRISLDLDCRSVSTGRVSKKSRDFDRAWDFSKPLSMSSKLEADADFLKPEGRPRSSAQ